MRRQVDVDSRISTEKHGIYTSVLICHQQSEPGVLPTAPPQLINPITPILPHRMTERGVDGATEKSVIKAVNTTRMASYNVKTSRVKLDHNPDVMTMTTFKPVEVALTELSSF